MRIVADENIPYAREAFSPLGEVVTRPGRELSAEDLKGCECLLVRSITPVNATLLEDSPVRFVASATIGTDHIDLDYLAAQGIEFANAPGCNAESAAEYVISVLFYLSTRRGFDPFSLRAGIIGYGNVGTRVKQKLDALGIQSLINDPPLEDAGDDRVNYVSLQTIIDECDFITCHVPLTRSGEHPTFHLLNASRLHELGDDTILFNAARGAVLDNRALSNLLEQRSDLTVFLDTWENEPRIDQKLLTQVDFASPHIAGYSAEGRLRGTQMIVDAACEFFAGHSDWTMQGYLPDLTTIDLSHATDDNLWRELFHQHYAVEQDHHRLIDLTRVNPERLGMEFDAQRKQYPKRYEFNRYAVKNIPDKKTASQIGRLLFQV